SLSILARFILFTYIFSLFMFFFFNDTPTTDIYTLSLHDALPIFRFAGLRIARDHDGSRDIGLRSVVLVVDEARKGFEVYHEDDRSEEHTSELQSRGHLVCRLLLEKKK